MTDSRDETVLAYVDASCFGGNEASLYGNPSGLRRLSQYLRNLTSASKSSKSTVFQHTGELLNESGLNVRFDLSNNMTKVAEAAFRNTLRFRKRKRQFYQEAKQEYLTRRPSSCKPRGDGAFAVAYLDIEADLTLVIAGNRLGLLHVASHLEGMADIVYEPYRPNWPENSEHYHSWIDGKEDVMLDCGLGLQYGRLDHRNDGSFDWMLEGREPNREGLRRLFPLPTR